MWERKVRLVEESATSTAQDFQLPSLAGLGNFGDSMMTEVAGRGSSSLDDIDVPVRRVERPLSVQVQASQNSKIDTHARRDEERNVEPPVPQIITTNISLTDSSFQLIATLVQSPLPPGERHYLKGIPTISTSPSNMNTSSRVEKTNTNTSIPIGSPLHTSEITRIVLEVGF